MSSSARGGPNQPLQRRILRTQTAGNLGESVFDSEVVPSSLEEIAPILRVANEVEKFNPRVAYLCKLSFFSVFYMHTYTCTVFLCQPLEGHLQPLLNFCP